MTILFFFNDTATTEIYTLSLHDALPISDGLERLLGRSVVGHKVCAVRVPHSVDHTCTPTHCQRGRSLPPPPPPRRSEEHTSELQSRQYLVCRLLLEKKKKKQHRTLHIYT